MTYGFDEHRELVDIEAQIEALQTACWGWAS